MRVIGHYQGLFYEAVIYALVTGFRLHGPVAPAPAGQNLEELLRRGNSTAAPRTSTVSQAQETGRSPANDILTLEEVASLSPCYSADHLQVGPDGAKLGKEWRFRKSIIDRSLDDQDDDSGFSHLRQQ